MTALPRRPHFPNPPTVFAAQDAVSTLLRYLGYDPDVPGLMDTPARVVRSLTEMTAGEEENAALHLTRVFPAERGADHDELIACTGITFTSLCEHHLLPFTGHATVAYVPAPGADVVGLSKLARIVDTYARRATMQERLTQQITTVLTENLDTVGTAAIVTGRHACMEVRGAMKPTATMVTSSLTGVFRDDASTRAELFALHNA